MTSDWFHFASQLAVCRQVNIFSNSRLKDEKLNSRSNREGVWLSFWYSNCHLKNPGTNDNLSHHNRAQCSNVTELIELNNHYGKVISCNYCRHLPKAEFNTKTPPNDPFKFIILAVYFSCPNRLIGIEVEWQRGNLCRE